MQESDGTFTQPDATRYTCRKCKQQTATRRVWESRCGGYEDEKLEGLGFPTQVREGEGWEEIEQRVRAQYMRGEI